MPTFQRTRSIVRPRIRFWPRGKALSSYTLALDTGFYALTGEAVGLIAARVITCVQGAYTLTGQAVSLLAARLLTMAQGSYTLTGEAVGLLAARTITIGQGSYVMTGQAVGLTGGFRITMTQGSYALSGQSVTLTFTGSYDPIVARIILTTSAGSRTRVAAGRTRTVVP